MNNATAENDIDLQEQADFYADDATFSVAVNICENCRQSCETLHDVPEWNFKGCTRCYDECMAELAAEAAAIPARIEPMQGSLFSQKEVA